MKLKIVFLLSLVIVIFSIIYIVTLLNKDFVLTKEEEFKDTITVWITTSGLVSALETYQRESGTQMNIKQFNTMDLLIEELELSTKEDSMPDVVEINANYGGDEVLQKGKPIPLETFSNVQLSSFLDSSINNFMYKKTYYGFPLGVTIPVLLINRSILDHHLSTEMVVAPFTSEKNLGKFKKIQAKINENNRLKPFWMFHFDETIPYYWYAYKQSDQYNGAPFREFWHSIINDLKLVPSMDSHMAITRFTNMEIGALVTTSEKLQTIQELTGNGFEYEVVPLFPDKSPLLTTGNGFISFNSQKKIDQFYKFLNNEKTQIEIHSNTGWMPAKKSLMNDSGYIYKLPMSKFLNKLTLRQEDFIGRNIIDDSRQNWIRIKEIAKKTEKE